METQKTELTEQKEPIEPKSTLPAVITDKQVELKIKTALVKHSLTVQDVEKRALAFVKNRDNLKVAAALLKDIEAIRGITENIHETTKAPYLVGAQACDKGRKVVFKELDRVEGMVKPWYDEELALVDSQKREQDLKKADVTANFQIIETNVINFSNRIVSSINRKDLLEVERHINLEKSPSMAKKYGNFHQQAIERYDAVLLPIVKDQKLKVDKLEELNIKVLEAEAHNDPDKMDALNHDIDALTNEILQNHAVIQDAALNQEAFPVIEATEILPDFKVKRTNYTIEIADVDVALKKARELLKFDINKDAAKSVLERLKKERAFEGKDEVIMDGIKYIATKEREAI